MPKQKAPFNIGEKLILPPAEDECSERFGEMAANKAGHVALSAITQLRRIDKIAEDVERQLFERLSESPWHAIQVDESTDAENQAILLVCARHIYQDDFQGDLLCTLFLRTKTI